MLPCSEVHRVALKDEIKKQNAFEHPEEEAYLNLLRTTAQLFARFEALFKPTVKADKPVGQWNRFWIKMVGDKVWVKLNDVLVVDGVVLENYWDYSKPIFPTGQIELQNHGNNLWFKNFYLRELPRN